MSKVAMDFLMSKLEYRGITAEVVEDTCRDEWVFQITGLAEHEERRVIAELLDLEVEELPPSYIKVNIGVMVQLIARFIINEIELERVRQKRTWYD